MELYNYKANIYNVVDGDTVDAVIDLGFRMTTIQRLRLAGVDCDEMNDKDITKRESAKKSKQYVIDKLLGMNVFLRTYKSDSFGRWIAIIYKDGVDFNQHLIDEGYAVKYK